MSAPGTLRVVRPYASEAEWIASEGWTIDAKGIVLVGAAELPAGTVVRFNVALADGTKLVTAEGKVVGMAAPTGERAGGLHVRFTRFGASTKAVIDRVIATRAALAAKPPSQRPDEISGVHSKPVPAPPDRDALLSRLRERARGLVKVTSADAADADESTG